MSSDGQSKLKGVDRVMSTLVSSMVFTLILGTVDKEENRLKIPSGRWGSMFSAKVAQGSFQDCLQTTVQVQPSEPAKPHPALNNHVSSLPGLLTHSPALGQRMALHSGERSWKK